MASKEVRKSSRAKPTFFYGYIVVVAALFIMAGMFGTYTSFGVFFKPVLTEFGWTRALTAGAFSLSLIWHGLLGIVMGGLTDRFGPRIVMTICGFLLGLGYSLMSQLSAVWQLYLFYGVIIGTGMGGAYIPLISIVGRWFVKRRSVMTGIVLVGAGIGMLIGPPIASRLISSFEWRTSYIILGSIGSVLVVLAAQLLKRDPSEVGQIPYGVNSGQEQKLKLETDSFSLKQVVHNKQFWILFTVLFCLGFSWFTVIVHIVPHTTEMGISAVSAANILATIGGISILGRIILGGVADRIGNKQTLIICFTLISIVLFWLVPATDVWKLYVFAAIMGFAYGGFTASWPALAATLFGLSSYGLFLGIIGLGYTIGAAIGPFVAGYIFDVTGSYQVAFLVSAAIGVVGLISATLLTPTKTS